MSLALKLELPLALANDISEFSSSLPDSPPKPLGIHLSPDSLLINGLRQSTLSFQSNRKLQLKNDSETEVKCRTKQIPTVLMERPIENIEPEQSQNVEPLPRHEGMGAKNAKEAPRTRGRPKKQAILSEVVSAPKPIQTKKTLRPTKTTRLRRSFSASSVPSTEPIKSEALKPVRHATNSVSPRKQLCAGSPVLTTNKPAPTNNLHQTLLSGFGVRRTARQFAKDMQKQREADVISAIVNNEESGMKVVHTELKGRGVISTRLFSSGEFIVEYAGELISDTEARLREVEYKKNPDLGSFMFFFSHGGLRYCVDATEETSRLGRLINHSRLEPNCFVKVIPINAQPHLALFAKTEIPPGEELLYDYGDRDRESLLTHPWLKY